MATDKCQRKGCPSYGRYCRALGHDKAGGKKEPAENIKPARKIRPVSKKTAKKMGKYSRAKKKLRQKPENQVCAIALIPDKSQKVIEIFQGCQFHSTDYDHPAGRSGEKLIPTEDGNHLCRHCHTILNDNPALASELGLSSTRLERSDKRKHLYPK
jgi:hypothetical protein